MKRADTSRSSDLFDVIDFSNESQDDNKLVSFKSQSIDFYDQARSRMNDTHRQGNRESDGGQYRFSEESKIEITD